MVAFAFAFLDRKGETPNLRGLGDLFDRSNASVVDINRGPADAPLLVKREEPDASFPCQVLLNDKLIKMFLDCDFPRCLMTNSSRCFLTVIFRVPVSNP